MLKCLIANGIFIAAPGVYDGFSSLLAQRFDFRAVYMSGYCVAASRFGLPDAGLIGLSDMLQVATLIRRTCDKPLIADADTGYGGLLNVQHTVREYEMAGVSAIQIEDQEMPKKCGHTKGKRVISAAEMVAKIEVATESRRSDNFLIIARTDSLATHGIAEAITRCKAYRSAGADVVLIDALPGIEEIRRVGGELGGNNGAVMINITPSASGFITPETDVTALRNLGFAIAIYPGMFAFPALGEMERAAQYFNSHGQMNDTRGPQSVSTHDLVGFPAVWADESRWQARYFEKSS